METRSVILHCMWDAAPREGGSHTRASRRENSWGIWTFPVLSSISNFYWYSVLSLAHRSNTKSWAVVGYKTHSCAMITERHSVRHPWFSTIHTWATSSSGYVIHSIPRGQPSLRAHEFWSWVEHTGYDPPQQNASPLPPSGNPVSKTLGNIYYNAKGCAGCWE